MKTSDFIEAHVAWKLKLRKYLDGLPVDFDVEKVRDATACQLGRWLQETPGQDELKKLHAAFHAMAAKVVDTSRRSGTAAARQLLASEEYAQATSAVVKALMGQPVASSQATPAAQSLPLDFNAVVVAHDAFHKAASDVVKAQREDPKKAEALLDSVVYREASSEVVNALSAWNRSH